MLFNVEKCKVIHIGYNNPRKNYETDETDLECLSHDRDRLRSLISAHLKWEKQCKSRPFTDNPRKCSFIAMITQYICISIYISLELIELYTYQHLV